MKRSPMGRGTGFARRAYVAPPAAPLRRVERAGVIARVSGAPAARPKSEAHRNPHLLTMARGRYCLLRVPGVCIGGTETTVASHSNLSIHGKAGARKANDEYHVPGCFACHRWLDQGPADGVLKAMTFMRAHLDQVGYWRAVAADTTQPPKDRTAAQWALDHLNATPVGQGETQ
jgi:hypothetical protein